jgi:multiple sugar transport system ATP-binding protein
MHMAFLEISHLVKNYGATKILKGINLTLEEGGFLVLIGPSGCGKSTLLNSIAGLESITSGEIKINGKIVNDLHPSQRDIAMVFQSYALYPNMNVAQNIGFALEMQGMPKAEREVAILKAAKTLQIEHLLTRKPAALSGGQRQRVAMGRALVRNPQLFLFDEPLSNLDAKLRIDMRLEIKRLHKTTGTSFLYVTHDQVEAMTLATKIAVLREGEIQQFGTPFEIYNAPANMFVADFMGAPAINFLEGTVRGGALQLDENLCIPLPASLGATENQQLIFGIRPEAISAFEANAPQSPTLIPLVCEIEMLESAGADIYALTTLAGKKVTARLKADHPVREGEKLTLMLNLEKGLFFDKMTTQNLAHFLFT